MAAIIIASTCISIHFLYTEEDPLAVERKMDLDISIHFLYTEEDYCYPAVGMPPGISIHFLYTEEDILPDREVQLPGHFNPLPLYRGRLPGSCRCSLGNMYFNPLPLYRGRLCFPEHRREGIHFNPLPLYRGRHRKVYGLISKYDDFNPLPLYRGRPDAEVIDKARKKFQSTSSIQRKTNQ